MACHILVIEDDVDAQALIQHRIRDECGAGTSVVTAMTLNQGARLLMTSDFDLIILDLSLPDGDGLDILEAVRAGLGNCDPEIPVAVFTGFDQKHAAQMIEARRASAYFKKTQEGLKGLGFWIKVTAERQERNRNRHRLRLVGRSVR